MQAVKAAGLVLTHLSLQRPLEPLEHFVSLFSQLLVTVNQTSVVWSIQFHPQVCQILIVVAVSRLARYSIVCARLPQLLGATDTVRFLSLYGRNRVVSVLLRFGILARPQNITCRPKERHQGQRPEWMISLR